MNWHFGARPPDGGDPPLFYDEVRHCIRKGDGSEVQLPFHAALILKLLLRMHARGRTVTPRELCAFLKLPEGTRVSGYVTDLRKKIAECGGDPKLIESITSNGGYRLATDIDAVSVAEAEELKVIERMLAHPEVTPSVRGQLKQLYAMLALSAAVVLGVGVRGWLGPDAGELPIRHHDPEEGELARRLVPDDGVRAFVRPVEGGSVKRTADGYEATLRRDAHTGAPAEACFELKAELGLRDRDVLAVELALLPPTAAARIAISVEKVPPVGIASTAFDVQSDAVGILRIPATQIAPDPRAHARTICIGEDKDVPGPQAGAVAIKVRGVRVE
jgi:hypothetical protein